MYNNPPPQSPPQTPPMTSIVKLTAENGETFHFPTAFLRENLKESIDKNSLQRVSFNLPISLPVVSILK